MITELKAKDILTDVSFYNAETVASIRMLVTILAIGDRTSNSCWIQGAENSALNFTNSCINELGKLYGGSAIVKNNMRYILSLTPGLGFRREYGKDTIGIDTEKVNKGDPIYDDIRELMRDFDPRFTKEYFRGTSQMSAMGGCLAKSLITYGNSIGLWSSPDEAGLQDKLITMIREAMRATDRYSPVLDIVNNLFQ